MGRENDRQAIQFQASDAVALRLTKPILLLAITLTIAGCARPGDHPISSNCVWIEDGSRSLNLENFADRRHMRFDATTAEDVAIRWADQHWARLPEYEERRDKCMDALFNGVASHHGIDVATIRKYSLERDRLVDAAVILGFGLLYALAAYYIAGRIRRRFPPGEPGFWIMALVMSVCVAVVGIAVGNFWAMVIETYRLNSGHLSYRMDRIPWRQHWPILLVCGVVIFALAALIRSRVAVKSFWATTR